MTSLRCARCRRIYTFRLEHRRCPRCRHQIATLVNPDPSEELAILAAERKLATDPAPTSDSSPNASIAGRGSLPVTAS